MSKLSHAVDPLDHVRGPEDAPVTLVEYGDYQCPHCREAHAAVEALLAQQGARVRFVYRHFPLTESHPLAQPAAEAAEAAGSQGKFWEMHRLLFEQQPRFSPAELVRWATELRLDLARFSQELAQGLHLPRLRAEVLAGVRSGVNGTPTFFVNGRRHDGRWDLEQLTRAVTDARR